uniref:Reverse transcriptase domain-containing protein n=1 Tax=Tanacetum cinerariifolium TaxID=118510 RepID=A0A6L2L6H1_TANCI|nr:reverse transcriptase domain-containing protein [Tanacetum cinerariifolium]
MEINTKDEPWFEDFANYLVANIIPKGITYQQKNKSFSDLKHYFWEEPYLFKVCSEGMIRRYVSESKTQTILDQCHHGPTDGYYGPNVTAKKVKDNKEKDKIRAKTEQNQEQTRSVKKSRIKPDKVKAQNRIPFLFFFKTHSQLRFIFSYSASLGHDPGCSSCGALYTTDYCYSDGNLKDKIICDLDKTPDLSQQPPQNCPKCGNPVDGHYCQGCALLRKKFKEDLFTSCIENRILQDSSEPSNDNTNVANALREPFVVNQVPGKNSSQSPPQINHHCCYGCGDSLEDIFCHQCTCELCGNGAHYGYNCPQKVLIVLNPKAFNNQTIKELPLTVPSFNLTCYSDDGNSFTYDSTSNLVHDSPNVFDPPSQLPLYSCEFCGNDAQQTAKTRYWKILACYDDDNEDYTIAITHKEPDNSLSKGDEHFDTIPTTKSDEFIKSSVEDLVPNPSESEGENEYIPKKIYSNPLFDEEIISMKIDPHHFNAESDLVESLYNHDSPIISSSSKIDSLFDELAGELTLLKSILTGINETDCDPVRNKKITTCKLL